MYFIGVMAQVGTFFTIALLLWGMTKMDVLELLCISAMVSSMVLDIVRLCLVIADSDDLKSGFREAGIKFESSEKYLLIKSCQDILQSYGVLGKSDEV